MKGFVFLSTNQDFPEKCKQNQNRYGVSMKVELDFLEKVVASIFREMKMRGIDGVQLDADFYWNVPSESIYDPYNEPGQLDIGQLEEDYETLRFAHKTDALIGYNLKNISPIMRYLSVKYPS